MTITMRGAVSGGAELRAEETAEWLTWSAELDRSPSAELRTALWGTSTCLRHLIRAVLREKVLADAFCTATNPP